MKFKDARIVKVAPLPTEYHSDLVANRGVLSFVMSAHSLKEYARNAERWVAGYESPESSSKELGDYVDCLWLTPQQWSQRFAVPPPYYTNKDGDKVKWRDDIRIKEVREWKEANAGRKAVDITLNGRAHGVIKSLEQNPRIKALSTCGTNQVWMAATYVDKATGLEIPVKGMVDIVPNVDDPEFGDSLVDLKTTKNASPRKFARDAFDYGYHIQAALYLDLWNSITGQERNQFIHIVVESFHPYTCRCPMLGQRFIDAGRFTYQNLLARYAMSLKTGEWPGYDRPGSWPVTEPEDWMVTAAMESLPELDVTAEYPEGDTEEDETEEVPDIIP